MRKLLDKNVILFTVGFCIYITIEVLFRGFSYPLMGVVGGITLILLDKINNKISWETDLTIQALIGSAIVTLFELIIGLIALYTSLPQMWDYSNMPLNFMGVICLPFSIAWCLLSVIGIFVADAINYYVYEELPIPYYKMFGCTILTFKEKECKL